MANPPYFHVHDVCKSFTIPTVHLYNMITYVYMAYRHKFLIIFVEF